MEPLPASVLPAGVRSRILPGINGLDIHVLEAGYEAKGRPAVLLLHGFPELAYSWRKVLPALAAAGYHAIAPDQRGYGRTTGWDADYDGDLAGFRFMNLLRDAIGVLFALGHRTAEAVVGHDFGASVAAYAALVRPDIFKRMVLMSAPFGGPPAVPFDTADKPPAAKGPDIHAALAALPRPRKHYQWYYSTRPANENMWKARQGVHDFLRAYYHHKSADWKANKPFELKGWIADELAKMPTYYIMDLADGMAETVAKEMPSAGRDRRQHMAARPRAQGLQRRICAHRLPGRPELVSRAHRRQGERRAGSLHRPHHRRALDLHLGPERLGHLPDARRHRPHAEDRLHEHEGDPPHRRRRPLGAAGEGGRGEPAAAAVPEVDIAMSAHASLAVLDSLAVEVITDNVSDTYVSKTSFAVSEFANVVLAGATEISGETLLAANLGYGLRLRSRIGEQPSTSLLFDTGTEGAIFIRNCRNLGARSRRGRGDRHHARPLGPHGRVAGGDRRHRRAAAAAAR